MKSLGGGVPHNLEYLAGKCRTFRIDGNGGGRGPAKRVALRVGETRASFRRVVGTDGVRVCHDSFGTGQKMGKPQAPSFDK